MEGRINQDLTQEDSKTSIFLATLNMLWNLSDAIDMQKTLIVLSALT